MFVYFFFCLFSLLSNLCFTQTVYTGNIPKGEYIENDPNIENIYDVIIIGGGMSGIAAGHALSQLPQSYNLNNYLIIEAEYTLGGRMKSGSFDDININLGAAWVSEVNLNHPNDNVMWYYANKYNLTTILDDAKTSSIAILPTEMYNNISMYNQSFIEIEMSKYWAQLAKTKKCIVALYNNLYKSAYQHKTNYIPSYDNDISVRTAFSLCNWTYIKPYSNNGLNSNDKIINSKLSEVSINDLLKLAVEWHIVDFEYALPPKYVSLFDGIGYFNEVLNKSDYKNYYVTDCRTYSHVPLSIASEYLNYTVNYSDPNCDKGIIEIKQENNEKHLRLGEYVFYVEYYNKGVYLYTKNTYGNNNDIRIYQSKYVIITVSLGVLQSNLITFYPELPFWKRRAINEFPMVDYLPIYVKFADNFWETEALNGKHNLFYPDKNRNYFINALNLNGMSKEWNNSNILRFDVTNELAVTLNYLNKQEIMNLIHNKLQKYYNFNISHPIDLMFNSWSSNPFILGTWMNWDIGINWKDNLRYSWPINRLFFSGEAVQMKFTGFTHSAYYSGLSTISEILLCEGKNGNIYVPFDHSTSAPSYYNGFDKNRQLHKWKYSKGCRNNRPHPRVGCTYPYSYNYNSRFIYDNGSCGPSIFSITAYCLLALIISINLTFCIINCYKNKKITLEKKFADNSSGVFV